MSYFGHDFELPGGFQEADFEQRALEDAGNASFRRIKRAGRLKAAGRLEEAAAMCTHSAGYGLSGSAAVDEKDPRAGEDGDRCSYCYSVLETPLWDDRSKVIHPCENKPES